MTRKKIKSPYLFIIKIKDLICSQRQSAPGNKSAFKCTLTPTQNRGKVNVIYFKMTSQLINKKKTSKSH